MHYIYLHSEREREKEREIHEVNIYWSINEYCMFDTLIYNTWDSF